MATTTSMRTISPKAAEALAALRKAKKRKQDAERRRKLAAAKRVSERAKGYERRNRSSVAHPVLEGRGAEGIWLVLRLDRYRTEPANRGQFYPTEVDEADLPSSKALWPSGELARHAADWAARQFGHQYGVFRLTQIVERQEAPVSVSVVA